ncbi:MAG: DNA-directed RNA polymerase subunit beta' [Anaerolineae bacterium]|nr:DNA-directed RNA polymerase subunit beta' [Anaerolineae bacterium]
MAAKDFTALRVSLASPDQIRKWSYGEVTKPETINYRRLRPEKDGLFCEAIFGPTRDWQCYCGKYKNIRYKGIICDKCGVEVTRSVVRRERMGHIELAAPVAHVWYTRRVPSYLGLLLDVSRKNLDRVLYFAQYVVTNVNEDARARAIRRIDREIEAKEAEVGDDIRTQMAEIRDTRDERLAEFETREAEINRHFDEELARLTDKLMADAATVQARLEVLRGKVAETDVVVGSANAVIVTKGEVVTNEHLARIKDVTNDYLNDLQTEIENQRRSALAELELEREQAKRTASDALDVRSTKLNDRMGDVMKAASEAKRELQQLHVLQFLSESSYRELRSKFGSVFEADMGAQAFHRILKGLDLEAMAAELWNELRHNKSKQRKKKATKRLKVVESLRKSSNRPEWMILEVLPVIPPDLRPMVQLDGGRFATSDLNDLYRRVINRNNRLKHLLELGAPDVIVRNEKRMLQEAVDSLIDNSQRGRALSRRGRRELKSLSDMLKGKKGRFRRNLLGKRVDYSGRSVIVIGPRLKLHQCGLPKTMALELYRPFVISKLVADSYAQNVKGAKRIIERERPEVWEALEHVIKDRPVLLNRAPTLHRLGIQAFEPILVEGKAIQIHPLVCSAFNADFDGDQMAVHVPLSEKAVQEARELMLSSRNLLKPADGQPIVAPAKDMVLGIYYLTMDPSVEVLSRVADADKFRTIDAVYDRDVRVGVAMRSNGYYYALKSQIPLLSVYDDERVTDDRGRAKVVKKAVDLTIEALLRGDIDIALFNGYEMDKIIRDRKLGDRLTLANLHERRLVSDIDEVEYLYRLGEVKLHTPILLGNIYDALPPQERPEITTVGRALFNRIVPDELRFVQETMGKKQLQDLVARSFQRLGADLTTELVDSIKNMGFYYATVSGTTVAVADLTVPEERARILQTADEAVQQAEREFRRGMLSEEERYQRTVDIWREAKDYLESLMKGTLDPYGPIAIMALSGSTKGGFGPITQLAGMRGLMSDPSGRIIDLPIRSHFREGLNALEYFISTHGARKGLADTALRTADAGYLTRRLVDVSQDVIVNRMDCGTTRYLTVRRSDDIGGQSVYERILGRVAALDMHDPESGTLIVGRNQMIDEDVADRIQRSKLEEAYVRSPLTCSLIHGICALCYGRDLGRGDMVGIGSAVGIVAAQSIGEPGTQLTLRTFHSGGTAQSSGDITSGLPRVEELFEARKKPKGESVMTDIAGILRLGKSGGVRTATVINSEVFSTEVNIPEGWSIEVADEAVIKAGTILGRAPNAEGAIPAEMDGTVYVEGRTLFIRYERTIEEVYEIPSTARLLPGIEDGMTVFAGQQLTDGAKNPHRILRVLGEEATQMYLLSEVHKVYRSQGVNISDKHFEIVIRKMLSKVQITSGGSTELLPGELIDRLQLIDINARVIEAGGEPAKAVPVLLGISKAALNTDSFLSASSFQHTIKVLAGAAIEGKVDRLYGLKENVIIGKLIPAGTGFHTYQDRELIAPNETLESQGALDRDAELLDDSDSEEMLMN